MKLKSISELKKIKNLKVWVRVDYNVDIKNGKVTNTERIERSLPTIKYLLKNGAAIILASHLGRPEGKKDPKYSLKPLLPYIKKFTRKKVYFIDDCIGVKVEKAINNLKANEILLLENLRFYAEEEKGDMNFAKKLATGADIYVNEAFSNCHRNHASMSVITKFLPAYGGLNLLDEVSHLSQALEKIKKPAVAIIGGLKISTKIKVIDNLIKKYDRILIGGALANNFFVAKKYNVGQSVVEKDYVSVAVKLLKKFDAKLIIPFDVLIADRLDTKAKVMAVDVKQLNQVKWPKFNIIDIGPKTVLFYSAIIKKSQTIIWNGPMGFFEVKKFSQGTYDIAKVVATVSQGKPYGVVGGGETLIALDDLKMYKFVDFVSTAGGAMLEFMEGKILPGLKPLIKK